MWELLFRHPRSAYDSGTLVLTNVAEPFWWWLGVALVSVALLASVLTGKRTRGWSLWRKLAIGALQASVVLGVIGLLAGPGLRLMKLQAGVNTIAVLIDRSGSMSFPLGKDSASISRLDGALTQTREELLPRLEELGEVTLFSFDTAARLEEDLDTLAAAYAELGDFANAIATQEAALELLDDAQRDLKAELENRLAVYQAGQAWRE